VELATLAWVHWYNTQRLHEYPGYVPPAEFEATYAANNTDQELVGIQWPESPSTCGRRTSTHVRYPRPLRWWLSKVNSGRTDPSVADRALHTSMYFVPVSFARVPAPGARGPGRSLQRAARHGSSSVAETQAWTSAFPF